MDLSLNGLHALVGGASRGIGRATALELALNGASVTCISRNQQELIAVVESLESSAGQDHQYIVGDANEPAALAAQVSELAARRAINIFINNTGGPPEGTAHAASTIEYQCAFTQHLLCSQAILHALLPGMRKSGYGRIVNVISTSVKQPIPGLGVSNTIRGAVANWAKTLAFELGPDGITVNNVLPGFTQTDRLDEILRNRSGQTGQSLAAVAEEMCKTVPLRRFGLPSETAAAIVFLASSAAAYINGVNLPVDGGRTSCL